MNWMVWDGTGEELAARILGERKQHLVVVSQRTDTDMLNLDAQYIAHELDGLAEVLVLRNYNTAYELSGIVPDHWQVFGDSARAYPAGASLEDGCPSKYVVAHDAGQLRRAADELIDLVEAMPLPAVAAATLAGRQDRVTKPVRQSGVVAGFLGAGERALLHLADGSRAVVRQEDVVPNVRLDWLMTIGQDVSGFVDPESRIIDVSDDVHIPGTGQVYQWGSVVLCLVESVDASSAQLTLVPNVSVTVPVADISSNPLDQADELLTAGQVVAARLLLDRGRKRLSLIDVDDEDMPVPAPTLIAGGTPWLELGRNLLPPSSEELAEGGAGAGTEDREHGISAPRTPAAPSRPALKEVELQLEAARAENRRLQKERQNNDADSLRADELQVELNNLRREFQEDARTIHALRSEARHKTELLMKAQNRARVAERRLGRTEGGDAKFSTVAEHFRHELYLAWVERVAATEKAKLPMQEFTVGPKFLDSFYAHSAEHRRKALRALVDLLTGRATSMPARQLHQLRTGAGGDDGPVVRSSDRARCMRMSVEVNAPAARRLHFWDLPSGTIELHELVPHDVTDP